MILVHIRPLRWAAAALLLLGAMHSGPARAQFTPINLPDAAYVGGTSLLRVTDPDFSVLSALSDGALTVSFSTDLAALTVPDTWTTWGAPPNTESATPRVLWTQGETSLALDFSFPLGLFGLEVEPNTGAVFPITATFFNGADVVGEITHDVDGNGGALLFAAQSSKPFTRVVLSSPDDFAVANLRYVPEPGALAMLLGMGIGGALLLRRTSRRR